MELDRYIIVFDFETDGLDTASCNPCQVAAIAVDLRNLQVVEDSEFNAYICPDDVDEPNYIKDHYRTLKFHADLQKTTIENVLKDWRSKGIKEKVAWTSFVDYCKKYRMGAKNGQLPVAGGQNIVNFDLPIAARLCEKHKVGFPFPKRDTFDLLNITPMWFLFSTSPPENYKLDTLRDYFGMSKEGAHDALTDVRQCAELIIKFLRLYKNITPRIEALNRVRAEESTAEEVAISEK